MLDHEPGARDLVRAAAERADRADPVLGTFLLRLDDQAAEAADRLDERAAAGAPPGPLYGALIGVKDVIAVREAPTTGQSRVYDPAWWRGRDAVAVHRLRRAGALVVGKTTTAEHALGRPEPGSGFPLPRNPWDPARWTGGSSCGSANGLPAGLFTLGLGTDTNGSIRIPAALCGVTGFKPTFGLVPTTGIRPLSPSLDTVGALARSVRDCARALAVMAGSRDPGGAGGAGGAAPEPVWREDLAGVRIGVPRALLDADADLTDDCRRAFAAALEQLRSLGARTVEIDLPEAGPLAAAQFATLMCEAFDTHAEGLRGRWEEYGRSFRGTAVLGALLGPPVLALAADTRERARRTLLDRLAGLDAVATPTWPGGAPRYADPAALRRISALPGIWNAVGFPAAALPMGFDADGLPLSLQLAAPPGRDVELAVVADVYQHSTGWHLREPRPFEYPGAERGFSVRPGEGAPTTAPAAATAASPGPDSADKPALRALAADLRRLGLPVGEQETAGLLPVWSRVAGLGAALAEPAARPA